MTTALLYMIAIVDVPLQQSATKCKKGRDVRGEIFRGQCHRNSQKCTDSTSKFCICTSFIKILDEFECAVNQASKQLA